MRKCYTCRCGGQEWVIYGGVQPDIRCVKCNAEYVLRLHMEDPTDFNGRAKHGGTRTEVNSESPKDYFDILAETPGGEDHPHEGAIGSVPL